MNFIRRLQAFLWVASAVAVAYTGWVFTGRIVDHERLEERSLRKKPPTSEEFERIYGGDDLRILQFYARDGEIRPGQETLLCYGVLHATKLRIEPRVEGMRPSVNRCLTIAPEQTTTSMLHAEGAKAAKATASVTVVVKQTPQR